MAAWDRERLFRLIPEARRHDWISDLTPLAWLFHTGSLGQAIAYADLFWPAFVEHDGCILLAERFEESTLRTWMTSTSGDRQAVEAVINHTHILALFDDRRGADPTREQVVYLGRVLRDMWAAKLRAEFPGRPLVVSFPDEELDDLSAYEITFFQERGPA